MRAQQEQSQVILQQHHEQQQQVRGHVKHTVHGSLLSQEGLLAAHQQSSHQNISFPLGNAITPVVSKFICLLI